ncbi:UDP-N-acetylmuramoyl-tripeptide--D-alanyl-D-alanine ligase [Patulibacter defluvii]|uniref:UDP-N-acetylmuramoyl-tripeptide--D-alanyl-D- alanine ligase n=1 Tax=Patulibacter defluvii TaxID=3095358 RepID=UPI002A755AAD|nr:UDP-N-acetylmuramoyl-tripeptide--D-alanyl-D-alanine ligase [Patulibacter sp. DM4]
MRDQDARWIAAVAGAELHRDIADGADGPGPSRVAIDSRAGRVGPGDLFVGIPGERVDGGRFAADALAAGAWGVLVRPEHAAAAAAGTSGAILLADDPAAALGRLATAWRRELGATVVGVTGSVGKTSTKDLLAAILAPQRRTVATDANLNTEIGLPLTVLGAPAGTEVLVLEMAMRGAGQIAELARIAEPDVAIVTNVAPVHVELLGSLQAIADAKAELLHGLVPGGTAIVPVDEPRLDRHRPHGVAITTFGPAGSGADVAPDRPDWPDFQLDGDVSPTLLRNLPAAVAAARAVGVEPAGRIAPRISALRGERLHLAGDVVVVVDCYNANPMSVTAALDDLAATASGRRVAVLGDMLELGPDERRYHAEIGAHARDAGVEVLVAVGDLSRHTGTGFAGAVHWVPDAAAAAELLPRVLEPGDTVLLKASRGIGLERVAAALTDGDRRHEEA